MTTMTTDDLIRILRSAAGEPELPDQDSDIMELRFDELGYDSLALLEAAGQIKAECGVRLADDAVTAIETPRALLSLINETAVDRS